MHAMGLTRDTRALQADLCSAARHKRVCFQEVSCLCRQSLLEDNSGDVRWQQHQHSNQQQHHSVLDQPSFQQAQLGELGVQMGTRQQSAARFAECHSELENHNGLADNGSAKQIKLSVYLRKEAGS